MRRFDLLIKDAIDMLDEIRIKSASENITERHLYNVQSILFMSLDSYEETQKEMNQPDQPAYQATKNDLMQSALDHYDELATKANHWISDIPKAIRAYYSEPNQPPKSAEEFLMKYGISSDTTIGIEGDVPLTELLKSYASQSAPRYVPDEEIDAMWPIDELDRSNPVYFVAIAKRNGAKAMRDKIFGGVKPSK